MGIFATGNFGNAPGDTARMNAAVRYKPCITQKVNHRLERKSYGWPHLAAALFLHDIS